MRVAAYQFGSCGDIDANFSAIRKAITRASKNKVRLLVFHECAACGYPPIEIAGIDLIDFNLLEKHIQEVQKLAKEHEMYVALGTIRELRDHYYNSLLFISPNGEIIGSYDKRAQWGWDLDNFSKGNSLGVLEIDGTKIGFRICFEIRFPEYFRDLLAQKVELCFVCFSDVSEEDLPERYDILKSHLRTRAAENAMTVISVNSISKFQTAPTAVFDINGCVIAESPKNEEYLLIYDYSKPEIGFSAEGRIKTSCDLIKAFSFGGEKSTMEITLAEATMTDCSQIHEMQIKAFSRLLDKYHDYDTNPGAETYERIVERMKQDFTDNYFILLDGIKIGAVRVVRMRGNTCRISPMFILPEFQGFGYAQQAIRKVESLYPQARQWTLDTIKQEAKLCHLYEKMGYIPTGKEEKIQDGMDIIFYAK